MKEEIKNRIPEVSDTEMAFGGGDTIPELLKEAKEKGFYNGNTPANKFFSKWFYSGLKEGELNFKEELDKKFKLNASRYLKSFMGSFAPKCCDNCTTLNDRGNVRRTLSCLDDTCSCHSPAPEKECEHKHHEYFGICYKCGKDMFDFKAGDIRLGTTTPNAKLKVAPAPTRTRMGGTR
jgi:hypothetical protein